MDTNSRCPRCGGEFVCEAETALQSPCPCFAVRLSDSTRAVIRDRYTTCLCVACLNVLQAEVAGQDLLMPQEPTP